MLRNLLKRAEADNVVEFRPKPWTLDDRKQAIVTAQRKILAALAEVAAAKADLEKAQQAFILAVEESDLGLKVEQIPFGSVDLDEVPPCPPT